MFKRILCGFVISIFIVANVCAKTEKLNLDGDHGKLSAVMQTPDNASKYPLVMIMHGFGANKNMNLFQQIADDLEKQNIASIRFDFNGHGQSEGNFRDMTILNEIEDAKKVYEYVRKLPAIDTISLVGHSQGGVVASFLSAELGLGKIKTIALLAPAGVLHDYAISGNAFGMQIDPANIPESVALPDGLTIGRKYIETAQKLDMYEPAEQYTGNVLIVHGTADKTVPYQYGEKYHEIYKNSEIVLLSDVDHLFSGHVDEVAKTVSDYLAEQLQ